MGSHTKAHVIVGPLHPSRLTLAPVPQTALAAANTVAQEAIGSFRTVRQCLYLVFPLLSCRLRQRLYLVFPLLSCRLRQRLYLVFPLLSCRLR